MHETSRFRRETDERLATHMELNFFVGQVLSRELAVVFDARKSSLKTRGTASANTSFHFNKGAQKGEAYWI